MVVSGQGKLGPLVRVVQVEPLEGYRVRVSFEDATERIVDLEAFLRGPIFDPIREDPALFRALTVDGGTISWPNGADIDPDVLYYGLEPAWQVERERAK